MVYDLRFNGVEWAEQSREEKAMLQAAWERLRVPVLAQAGVTFGR